jgi:hypothetical protein
MHRTRYLLTFCSILPLAAGSAFADLTVSVQIDGHSKLVISTGAAGGPAKMAWDHLYAARPGTAGGSFPTLLNGYHWFPTWPATPNGTPGMSSFLEIASTFPAEGVTLTQQSGRTPVSIVQQPNAGNAFTLVIDFDDSAPPGADDYSITLQGIPFALLPTETENIVVNGSFETPGLASGEHTHPSTDDFAPWQTSDQNFEIWSDGVLPSISPDGKQNLEILSFAVDATVWQVLPTIPNEDYSFSFYHSPRPGIISTLTVMIDSNVVATISEDGSALNDFNWRKFRTNFTAGASSTTISFSDSASTAAGTHIDGVVVKRLPLRSQIRVSEIEVSWESVDQKSYQIQYRSDLATNGWLDFGSPVLGNGTTNTVKAIVPVGEHQRFYRVMTVP